VISGQSTNYSPEQQQYQTSSNIFQWETGKQSGEVFPSPARQFLKSKNFQKIII